jgi:hypothetical protein
MTATAMTDLQAPLLLLLLLLPPLLATQMTHSTTPSSR